MSETLTQFGTSFQSKIIASLLGNIKFIQTISDILNPSMFDSDSNKWLVRNIKDYYYEYKKQPTLEVIKYKIDEMDDDVVEIGFNPANTHLFVDMATGQAVKGAEVATVIGNRVYAKGVTYMKKADAPEPKPASDGTPLESEVRYKFKKGGLV